MAQEIRDVLSVREVGARLGVSASRVYQLVAGRQIPSIRRGRSIVIPRQAWERWISEEARRAMSAVGTAPAEAEA